MRRELSDLRLLEVCEGLYRRARAGTLHGLTGVDDQYDPPQ